MQLVDCDHVGIVRPAHCLSNNICQLKNSDLCGKLCLVGKMICGHQLFAAKNYFVSEPYIKMVEAGVAVDLRQKGLGRIMDASHLRDQSLSLHFAVLSASRQGRACPHISPMAPRW